MDTSYNGAAAIITGHQKHAVIHCVGYHLSHSAFIEANNELGLLKESIGHERIVGYLDNIMDIVQRRYSKSVRHLNLAHVSLLLSLVCVWGVTVDYA